MREQNFIFYFVADDMTEEIPSEDGSVRMAGLQAFLPKEHCGRIVMLPILEHGVSEVRFFFFEFFPNRCMVKMRTFAQKKY